MERHRGHRVYWSHSICKHQSTAKFVLAMLFQLNESYQYCNLRNLNTWSRRVASLERFSKRAMENVFGLTVHVHPVALLAIVDSHERRSENAKRAIGSLLGVKEKRGVVTITNAYAVPHNETDEEVGRQCRVWVLSALLCRPFVLSALLGSSGYGFQRWNDQAPPQGAPERDHRGMVS